jgi:vancomycin resistance protein YoaR
MALALVIWAASQPPRWQVAAAYRTSLAQRTSSQIHNVNLAIKEINGKVLQPGAVFSFNHTVGSWTAERGYVKAPVSYDGELIRDWGGGVCQTSTTLYNAALLAGLQIVERHHHHWPARYAPLGRDAAVAYSDIDLKFRNTLSAPVRIVGEVTGDKLSFRLLSLHKPDYRVQVESQVRTITRPGQIVLSSAGHEGGRLKLINRGHPGFCVATYRRFTGPHISRRELISQDSYPVMDRVVRLAVR